MAQQLAKELLALNQTNKIVSPTGETILFISFSFGEAKNLFYILILAPQLQ